MEQQQTIEARPEVFAPGTFLPQGQARSVALQPRQTLQLESQTRSVASQPRQGSQAGSRCAIPIWVRHEAMRMPFALLWHSFGLAYDGNVVYVRLIGMGKHGHGVGVAPRGATRAKRARYYVRKRKTGWQVRDRKHKSGCKAVATVKTRRAAVALMHELKKKLKATKKRTKTTKKRKPRSTA